MGYPQRRIFERRRGFIKLIDVVNIPKVISVSY
jgi:hypothetical protein